MADPIVPDSLADRYGRAGGTRARPRKRWVYWSLLAAFILAGVGVTVGYYHNFGPDPITVEDAGFSVVDDHSVRITFTVTRDHPERAADCVVRARDGDGTETGRREVYVPPTDGPATMRTVLRTTERATTGESYGCSYQVPRYLSSSTPPTG